MNLVAVCMMFTDEHSKKVQKKSDQLLAEVKQVALDYQSKVEQALNKQETEIRATYEAYYKADLADKQERLEIIQQLNDNYAKIERYRQTLQERSDKFDQQRNIKGTKHLDAAKARTSAFHKALIQSIHKTTIMRPEARAGAAS